jgi:hypothetical protein
MHGLRFYRDKSCYPVWDWLAQEAGSPRNEEANGQGVQREIIVAHLALIVNGPVSQEGAGWLLNRLIPQERKLADC